MQNYTILIEGKEPIAAYESEYKGKVYFHIRKMYDKDGEMQPGKGIGVPIEQREILLKAITQLKTKQLKVVGGK